MPQGVFDDFRSGDGPAAKHDSDVVEQCLLAEERFDRFQLDHGQTLRGGQDCSGSETSSSRCVERLEVDAALNVGPTDPTDQDSSRYGQPRLPRSACTYGVCRPFDTERMFG